MGYKCDSNLRQTLCWRENETKTDFCEFYLDSVFCVEVGSSQTGVQVVSQRLQSFHSGQQLALVLGSDK